MENKNKLSNTPVILALLNIFVGIIGIVYSIIYVKYNVNGVALGFFTPLLVVVIFSVFFFAALTTKKAKMIKVLNILFNIASLVINAITCLVTYFLFIETKKDANFVAQASYPTYFGLSLIILVASILTFIYFIMSLKHDNAPLYKPMVIVTCVLIGLFALSALIFNILDVVANKVFLSLEDVFLLVCYTGLTVLPLLTMNFIKASQKEEEERLALEQQEQTEEVKE